MKFLALGDSYTIGESVAASERWPEQLAGLLREQDVMIDELITVAKTGWTTDELATAIDAADPQGPFDLVSLLIGVNNQYRGLDQHEYRQEFVTLLERAIGFAGQEPLHVIVLSIPDWSVTPFAQDRDRAAIRREVDAFNAINLEETKRLGAHYVDVTPGSREAESDSSLIAPDGLHPSGKMYAAWAHLTLPVAREALAGR